MPVVKYRDINMSEARLKVVEQANAIAREYIAQGFDLTLRQVYYQFVSRGLIQNKDQEYKRLGDIINDARLSGRMDWNYITDRTRFLRSQTSWTSPAQIIRAAAYGFTMDKWVGQPNRVEIWIEKDALVGVITNICDELNIGYFSCRGYTSQSEMWAASQRLLRYRRAGQEPVIFHLGDHDPSGIDMSRDIEDRLGLFMGRPPRFERLALNMDQVEQYGPPPNPAKLTDSRSNSYLENYGDESWELDALDPNTIVALIRKAVEGVRADDPYRAVLIEEARHKRNLEAVEADWLAIAKRYSERESSPDDDPMLPHAYRGEDGQDDCELCGQHWFDWLHDDPMSEHEFVDGEDETSCALCAEGRIHYLHTDRAEWMEDTDADA